MTALSTYVRTSSPWRARIAVLALAALLAPGLSAGRADAALLAYYDFDSDVTSDSSGNGLHLTASGDPMLTSGVSGTGVFLNNDFLWNSSSLFDIGGADFAVSLWYKAVFPFTNFMPLVSKNHTNSDLGWNLSLSGTIAEAARRLHATGS